MREKIYAGLGVLLTQAGGVLLLAGGHLVQRGAALLMRDTSAIAPMWQDEEGATHQSDFLGFEESLAASALRVERTSPPRAIVEDVIDPWLKPAAGSAAARGRR